MSEATLTTKIVSVPHLGGTKISYHLPKAIVGSKPTLILINAYTVNASVFRPQVTDTSLLDEVNIVAFEPLGHGGSSTVSPSFTFWDSAIAFTQAMDALGIKKAFLLGSSQGGAIAVRLALIAPARVTGIISICSNLGAEGPHSKELGNADLGGPITASLEKISKPDQDFTPPSDLVPSLAPLSLGPNPAEADLKLWTAMAEKTYSGEAGRLRYRQASIAFLSRDSLHLRLDAVTAPVLWIRGSEDSIFTKKSADEDIAKFVNAKVQFETVEGAWHAPNYTHAAEVNKLVVGFIKKNGGKVDARALREAVGMVDI